MGGDSIMFSWTLLSCSSRHYRYSIRKQRPFQISQPIYILQCHIVWSYTGSLVATTSKPPPIAAWSVATVVWFAVGVLRSLRLCQLQSVGVAWLGKMWCVAMAVIQHVTFVVKWQKQLCGVDQYFCDVPALLYSLVTFRPFALRAIAGCIVLHWVAYCITFQLRLG